MPRPLEDIRKDLQSYKAMAKRGQRGVTLYSDKYIEDVESLFAALDAQAAPEPAPKAETKPEPTVTRRRKAKAPQD